MKRQKRTDVFPIQYPKGLGLSDQQFCRRLISDVRAWIGTEAVVIIACSGGIDSTVLLHAVAQGLRIRPYNIRNGIINSTAVYVNHNLRPEEVRAEAEHVERLARQYLTFPLPPIELQIEHGSGLQERARDARYSALAALAENIQCSLEVTYTGRSTSQESSEPVKIRLPVTILTGHNKTDNVETRVMNFLKGRNSEGIPSHRQLSDLVWVRRPLLSFSRSDIERYAKCFGLTWMEDSSNSKDTYTRNKVRHHLIPWIEEHINPGLMKTLGEQYNKVG